MPACVSTVTALTCATGGSCIVGDTGPGGGKVFYVRADGGTFTSTGSDCGTACKYLEAAPTDQSAGIVWATTDAFCYNAIGTTANNNCQTLSIYSGNTTAQATSRTAANGIGKGMANTNQIYARVSNGGGASTSAYAAGIAWAYDYKGKTDWHLPSRDEWSQLYIQRATVGGFLTDDYWSSSESSASAAWFQRLSDGGKYTRAKTYNTHGVRPVRAFG